MGGCGEPFPLAALTGMAWLAGEGPLETPRGWGGPGVTSVERVHLVVCLSPFSLLPPTHLSCAGGKKTPHPPPCPGQGGGWRVGAGRPWPQHPDPRPSRRVKAGAPWVSLSKGPSLKPLPIRQALRGWLCHFTSTNPEYLLCAWIQRRIKPIHSFIHSFLRSSNKCQLSTCMCQAQSYAPGI